jgi:hypothetical protein
MNANDLLPVSERKKILEDIGKQIVTLHKERIQKQIEVDGTPMPSLSPHTEERKKKKGGRSKVNATKRMMDTGDFMQNAFEYKVDADGTGLKISISNDKHEWRKQFAMAIEKKKERQKKMGFNKWAKSSGSGRDVVLTGLSYKTIAMQQLRGEFGNDSWRHARNPGAKFFGLNENDINKYKKIVMDKAFPIIKQNFQEGLKKMLKIK